MNINTPTSSLTSLLYGISGIPPLANSPESMPRLESPKAKDSLHSAFTLEDILGPDLHSRELELFSKELFVKPNNQHLEEPQLFHLETLGPDFAPQELAKIREQLLYPITQIKGDIKAQVLAMAKEELDDIPTSIDLKVLEYTCFSYLTSLPYYTDKEEYYKALNDLKEKLEANINECIQVLSSIELLSIDEVFELTDQGKDIKGFFSRPEYSTIPFAMVRFYDVCAKIVAKKDISSTPSQRHINNLKKIHALGKKPSIKKTQAINEYYAQVASDIRDTIFQRLSLDKGIRLAPQVFGLPSDYNPSLDTSKQEGLSEYLILHTSLLQPHEKEKINKLPNNEIVKLGVTEITEKYISSYSERCRRINGYNAMYGDYIKQNPMPLRKGERFFTLHLEPHQEPLRLTIQVPNSFEITDNSSEECSVYLPKGQTEDNHTQLLKILTKNKSLNNAEQEVALTIQQIENSGAKNIQPLIHPAISKIDDINCVYAVYSVEINNLKQIISMYYAKSSRNLVGYHYIVKAGPRMTSSQAFVAVQNFYTKNFRILD